MKSRLARTGTALLGALAGTLLAAGAASAQPAYPSVTQAQLDNASSSNGWLMYNRSYAGDDYAPFSQINTKNVASLKTVWSSAKIDIPDGFEGTPIVNGDYMFATTPLDHLIAFNAKTGQKLWEYDYDLPK
ncbi:MAG: PQQ-dependent dehydrogenase, methanol/ethanol family, partial [Acidiphilium sp. 37-67-22]